MPKRTMPLKEFAGLIQVSPGQVRKYVRSGKIDGPALVRVGGKVHIDPILAKRQLRSRLAPPTSGRALSGGARLDDDDPPGGGRTLNDEIKRELLRGIRFKNRDAERDAAHRAARFMLAADATTLAARTVETTLRLIEAELPGMAKALAGTFKVPLRDVEALVADQMKTIRRRATAERRTGNGRGR